MDLSRKDNKNKSQASTKGRWTAGYLSLCQLRCLLIAADILPTLFKSKLFWCTAFFCFFPNGGHSLEMPPSPLSAENLNIWQNLLIITPFVLTVLSNFPRCSKHFWSSCMQSEVNTHRFYPLAGEKDLTVERNPEIPISYKFSNKKKKKNQISFIFNTAEIWYTFIW